MNEILTLKKRSLFLLVFVDVAVLFIRINKYMLVITAAKATSINKIPITISKGFKFIPL